jgi:hypothetical protein
MEETKEDKVVNASVQLSNYRKLQHEKFMAMNKEKIAEDDNKKLLEKVSKFFGKTLEFNPEKRNNSRVIRFFNKYLFIKPINMDESEISSIPGKFRLRIKININKDNKKMMEHPCIPDDILTDDPELNKAILESLIFNNDSDSKVSTDNNFNKILAWVLIDLRIYGQSPSLPIHMNGEEFYLTYEQTKRIRDEWKKINPETESGIRFQLLLDESKSFADAYNFDKVC